MSYHIFIVSLPRVRIGVRIHRGLVTANIIPLSPAAANAMLAVGGAQLGTFILGALIILSGQYGNYHPSFNPKLQPPKK
jgi:hypothetical protein